MTCSACSNGLEKYLNKQEGVQANVNLIMATATIFYDENIVSIEDIKQYIKNAGFKVGSNSLKDNHSKNIKLLIFFGILVIFSMYLSMGDMFNLNIPDILNKHVYPKNYVFISLIMALLTLFWGKDILISGFKNLIHKMPNMDTLVGMGVIVNFLFSLYNAYFIYLDKGSLDKIFFDSVLMIIFLVKLGRYIDKNNKDKVVDVIRNLVTITPQKARVLKDNMEVELTLNEIKKGDIVICKPGEKIAVDGEIIKGSTHTDESFITGESQPVKKKMGDFCLAGSLNYDGYIEYKAVKVGKDSSISNIIDLVVEATNTKAPIARLADKISSYFVPFIFLIAILTFLVNLLFTQNMSLSITALVSILVVACPCALGLATPLAIVVSLGHASRLGFIIKTSESVENLNKIDTIIFDKTGTLTEGKMTIEDVMIKKNVSLDETLKILKSLEMKSNHPIAKSICENKILPYETLNFKEKSGLGVSGKINGQKYYAGNEKYLQQFNQKNIFAKQAQKYLKAGMTLVYLWNDKELIALYGLRDKVKPNIKQLIKKLQELNYQTIMLTGDNTSTAKIIAKETAITKIYSNMSPQEKLNTIKKLNTHQNVLMVGDGINDSPALKAATIGISVSNGTDISSDASDIIMLSNDMTKLISLLKLGKKTMRVIKENLFWAFIYNLLMIPLATGLFELKINPMLASLAMILSSLTVVLNSLRLKK